VISSSSPAIQEFGCHKALVRVFTDKQTSGAAAAQQAGQIIRDAIARNGSARIIVGTGPSQEAVVHFLTREDSIRWNQVEVFHMDEYVGIAADHPASFRRWLKTHLADIVSPARVHLLNGNASNIETEMQRYTGELNRAPIDLCFIGFGENGHIAFNDPHEADFHDPRRVKIVTLDQACRKQQVDEGHFRTIDDVPKQAISLTCPALMMARHVISCVPDRRKAQAVRGALEGPLSTSCPASLVPTHPDATIYLDRESASLLSNQFIGAAS
jgi:glucosamine-6-phosphate deaminase